MQFDNLIKDVPEELNDCNCLDKLDQDRTNTFIRLLKSDVANISDEHFLSHWEEGRRPAQNSCKEVCNYKGVSLFRYDHDVNDYITNIKNNIPRFGKVLLFKFNQDAGLVKQTSLHKGINLYHCNLFKCDSFNCETSIEIDKIVDV